jgi:hypothetical protein
MQLAQTLTHSTTKKICGMKTGQPLSNSILNYYFAADK